MITPGDFLSIDPNHIIPDSCCSDEDNQDTEGKISTTDKLLDIWKQGQKNLNWFWVLWTNDYLLKSWRTNSNVIETCQKALEQDPSGWRCSINKGKLTLWNMEGWEDT